MAQNNLQLVTSVLKVNRWFFYFIGLAIVALGVSSVIESNMGASAWDAFYGGLTGTFGLTPGTWVIIMGLVVIFLNSFLSKERPDFPAFLTIFTLGMIIDFCLLFIYEHVELNGMSTRILLFVFGFIMISIGSGIYLQAKFAPHPMDKLMFVLHNKFGLSIGVARLLCEATALLLGLLLSGPVSYGTAVIALSIGPCIQFAYKKMEKVYEHIVCCINKGNFAKF